MTKNTVLFMLFLKLQGFLASKKARIQNVEKILTYLNSDDVVQCELLNRKTASKTYI